MIGSPRMDNEIIHSWCFHDVECFDSTPSAAIIILDEDLERFLSLKSQQWYQIQVVLLISFPTSPKTSKTDKKWRSYGISIIVITGRRTSSTWFDAGAICEDTWHPCISIVPSGDMCRDTWYPCMVMASWGDMWRTHVHHACACTLVMTCGETHVSHAWT